MKAVDPDLVRACQRGESGALAALADACYEDVWLLALRVTGNRADAADVTQEVFAKMATAVVAFRAESAFSTWLFRVTTNAAITALRKRRHDGGSIDDQPEQAVDRVSDLPEEAALRSDTTRRVHRALAALSADDRAVVVLHDLEGTSTADCAELLGITPGALRVRLHRAHRRLAVILGSFDEPEND